MTSGEPLRSVQSTSRRSIVLAGLLLAVLVATGAHPQESPRRVAFSVGSEPGSEADTRARTLFYALGIDAKDLDMVHGLDPLLGDEDMGLFVQPTVSTCDSLPMNAAEFETALQAADDLFPLAEYAQALEALVALRGRLPCMNEPILVERLHRLYLLEGVARWFGREPEGAHEAFRRAVAVDPNYSWGGEFGPGAQELHLEAAREVLAAQKVTLQLAFAGAKTMITVDGRSVVLPSGRAELELPIGSHLIQVKRVDATEYVALLDLTGDVALVDRQALHEGIRELASKRSEGAGKPVLLALALWMEEQGYEDGWVVLTRHVARQEAGLSPDSEPPQNHVMRIDVAKRELARPGAVADRLKSYPYLFRVYLGGGTMLYNREERVYAYGVVRTSLMFAALPYMAAGFTLEMGFWRDPDSQQLYFVIPLHATIRVGPEVGPVQPYMGFSGVGLWLGERLGPTFTVGGELLGGVEIRPFDRRRLGFHLGLGGGYVDGLMFNANLGVTAQW